MTNVSRFNGAADFHRRKCTATSTANAACLTLQWGRRFSSAEIVGEHVGDVLGEQRFNGAADFHRRK